MTERKSALPPWAVWLLWVGANALAFAAVWLLSFALLALAKILFGPLNEDRILGYIVLPLAVLLPVLLQWLVLRHLFRPAAPWIAASIAGWASVVVVGIVTTRVSVEFMQMILGAGFLPLAFALLGLMLGAAQWLVLRQHAARASWYVLASALGWPALILVIGPTINNLAEMTAIGLVPALFTGAALAYMLGKVPPPESAIRQMSAQQ